MRKPIKILILVLVLALLGTGVFGFLWVKNNYVLIDKTFYSKDLQVLDLRAENISVGQYQKFHSKLPNCQILWNIPFQDTAYPHDSTELTVTELSVKDVRDLAHFQQLKVLNAQQCTDYAQLLSAAENYPELQVLYQVTIDGTAYPQDAKLLQVENFSAADLSLLQALPQLETVAISGAATLQDAKQLQEYCRSASVTFCIMLGKEAYSEDAQQITVEGITDAQLELLDLMPSLKKLHLQDPAASAESILALGDSRSDLTLTWDKNICGKVYSWDTEEVDLSDTTVSSVEEVEQAMAYLPKATNLFLGFCGLDNEEISAYRERSREKYKVVWVVDLSGKMKVRTDIDNFMPSRDGWGYVRDHEIDNIRYCEDLICIDIGHMGVKDVSFLETLTKLEYLILAHTEVQYIEPIVHCKSLRYLELDWSCIRDLSPLVHCTALEDLNIGMTWPDITPVLQMTWLKNLYIIKGNTRANFAEHLPNTRVVVRGDYTVSSGWRNLPNYYAMRDILGMHYM